MENNVPDSKELAGIIKDTRKAQGLTQDDLAGLIGTGRRFISDLEKGKSTVQLGKVLLVLSALGIGLYAFSKWKK